MQEILNTLTNTEMKRQLPNWLKKQLIMEFLLVKTYILKKSKKRRKKNRIEKLPIMITIVRKHIVRMVRMKIVAMML